MEWRVFVCSSCEPDDPFRYLEPMSKDVHPDASGSLDFCPRCGEDLPFTSAGVGEIIVLQRTKGYGDIPIEPSGGVL